MMRQIGKQILTIVAVLALLAAAGAVRADGLVTTIVTDPLTGVAIDGYDPVSYFTDGEPVAGKPDYEYDWGGVPWYFASAANRDVFMRYPDVYAPQFGGHCVMSLSRGYLSDGKARLYVIEAQRLYLFYSSANRDAFLLSRRAALESAVANWSGLSGQLTGPGGEAPASSAIVADGSSSAAASSDAAGVSSMPADAGTSASVAPDAAAGNVGNN